MIKNLFAMILIVCLAFIFNAFASIESETTVNVFKIDRSRNTDQVVYDIRLNVDNTIDTAYPLHVYWLKQSGKVKAEPLTRIQSKHGYGAKIVNQSAKELQFSIAAIPDQTFVVKTDKNEKYNAFTSFDNQEVIVNSIYIAFKEGTIWVPKIDSVQLKCTNSLSNKALTKTIFP